MQPLLPHGPVSMIGGLNEVVGPHPAGGGQQELLGLIPGKQQPKLSHFHCSMDISVEQPAAETVAIAMSSKTCKPRILSTPAPCWTLMTAQF
jgi:hypothetical protein